MRVHSLSMTLIASLTAASCSRSCSDNDGAGRIGDPESGLFVTCDRDGYTVINQGDEPVYVIINSFCQLNTAEAGEVGPHGEVMSKVIHGSGAAEVDPFGKTILPGTEVSQTYDLSIVNSCDDYTDAPPGQFENSPVPLTSEGPADAMMMHLHVQGTGVTNASYSYSQRVICRY